MHELYDLQLSFNLVCRNNMLVWFSQNFSFLCYWCHLYFLLGVVCSDISFRSTSQTSVFLMLFLFILIAILKKSEFFSVNCFIIVSLLLFLSYI